MSEDFGTPKIFFLKRAFLRFSRGVLIYRKNIEKPIYRLKSKYRLSLSKKILSIKNIGYRRNFGLITDIFDFFKKPKNLKSKWQKWQKMAKKWQKTKFCHFLRFVISRKRLVLELWLFYAKMCRRVNLYNKIFFLTDLAQ